MKRHNALFRLTLSERDEAIIRKLMKDKTQTAFRVRLRGKVVEWALHGGKDFLSRNEWNYLRSIYSDDL